VTEATELDHAIVRVTDAGVFYRASALGGCFRALWAARNGFEAKSPPDAMQQIFDRGHEIEDIVLNRMEADGWTIYDRQKEITIPIPGTDPPCFIVGHIDAHGTPPEGLNPTDPESHLFEHVVEVKGFGRSYMDRYRQSGLKAFPQYRIQAGAYAIGSRCGDIVFTVYDKESDTYSVQFIENDVPEWQLHALVLAVEEMTRKAELPSCTNNYPCPYYYMHDPKEMPMPLDALQNTYVESYLNLSEQIKLLTDARTMVTDQLKTSLDWVDGDPMSYDASRAIVTVVQNTPSLDRPKLFKLLQDAGEDPDNYLLPSSGWHLRISAKKERPIV
jgi:hypothetical protein